MNNKEAQKMLIAKIECMKREASGIELDCIYRNCDECSLCYAQGTTGDQIEALNMAVKALITVNSPSLTLKCLEEFCADVMANAIENNNNLSSGNKCRTYDRTRT